jgi:hypothetical protein
MASQKLLLVRRELFEIRDLLTASALTGRL